jgi:hypothetical protein
MRRTAFPGTARQGRCVAVQVSEGSLTLRARLFGRGKRSLRVTCVMRKELYYGMGT